MSCWMEEDDVVADAEGAVEAAPAKKLKSALDEPWAKLCKKTPTGGACKACLAVMRLAWPGETWDAMVLRCKTQQEIAEEVRRARAVYIGATKANFMTQDFQVHAEVGVTVERSFVFIPEEDFPTIFKAKLKDMPSLQQHIETHPDELGRPTQGIVIQHPNEPWRVLRMQSAQRSNLTDRYMDGARQIRPQQGAAVQSWYLQDQRAALPKSLMQQSLMKLQDVEALVLADVEKQQTAGSEEAQVEKPPCGPDTAQEQEEEEESEEDDPVPALEAHLPSAKQHAEKKGKGRGRGKGQGGGKSKSKGKKKSNATVVEDGEVSCRSRSPAASRKTLKHKTSPEGGTAAEKVVTHMTALSVKDALRGKKMGNEIRFAERALSTLDDTKYPTETTTLKAQIQAVKDAVTVNAENVASMPAEARRTTIAKVAKMTRSFPDAFMSSLLAVELRDLVLENELDVNTWVQMLSPVVSGAGLEQRVVEKAEQERERERANM
eukprot:6482185-Amphidinium_carterae.2